MERLAHISKDFRTQTLDEHLEGTARLAAEFAAVAGEERCAAFLGRIHDAGKAAAKWQNYLKKSSGYDESIPEEGCSKGSHTSAGAAYILKNLPDPLNLLLAYTVAGHHAGLPDFYDSGHGDSILKRFFKDGGVLKTELLDDAEEYSQQPASEWSAPYALTRFYDEYTHMAVRFLFSCLVDADWLDTERFMKPEDFAARREPTSLNELKRRFDAYMEEMRRRAPETYVNRIRNQILERCIEAGGLAPGFFSLTVPTGGGKTLSSLAFALTHALAHGKRRIIIAEPYTSIIEQISKVLKYGADDDGEIKLRAARGEQLFGEENVLEHHSRVDPDRELYSNRLAAQNWDAPVVVTTNVQLFESLLAASPGRCRKLHNIAQSVIILDEAQKIPAAHLRAVLSALKGLVKHFGVTVLLCTATQPALNGEISGEKTTLDGIEECTEIISDTAELYNSLKRVEYRIYRDDLQYPRVVGGDCRRACKGASGPLRRQQAQRLPRACQAHAGGDDSAFGLHVRRGDKLAYIGNKTEAAARRERPRRINAARRGGRRRGLPRRLARARAARFNCAGGGALQPRRETGARRVRRLQPGVRAVRRNKDGRAGYAHICVKAGIFRQSLPEMVRQVFPAFLSRLRQPRR